MAQPFILLTILTHLSIANVWNVAVIGTQIDKRWWYQFPLLKWRCLKSKNIDDINIHSWDGRVNPHVDKYWWFDIYFWDGGWQILMIYQILILMILIFTCEMEVSVSKTHSSRSRRSRRWQERTSACPSSFSWWTWSLVWWSCLWSLSWWSCPWSLPWWSWAWWSWAWL